MTSHNEAGWIQAAEEQQEKQGVIHDVGDAVILARI
jgi:uncharacterized phage-associated protein